MFFSCNKLYCKRIRKIRGYFKMNWKAFFLGTAAGLIGGYAIKEVFSNKINVSPEKVLEQVKNHFKQQGPISGSWIYMKAEPYEKSKIHYEVYKGGISKHHNGKTEQYEFIADASTGTILDVNQLAV